MAVLGIIVLLVGLRDENLTNRLILIWLDPRRSWELSPSAFTTHSYIHFATILVRSWLELPALTISGTMSVG